MIDYIFNEKETTKHIFDRSLKHIVEKCFAGFNAFICAYGETGSGKTFTMKGTEDQAGLVPLTIQHCLNMNQKDTHIISASYVELDNYEQFYDLFQ